MITPLGKNVLLKKIEEEAKKGNLLLINQNPEFIKAIVCDVGTKCEEQLRAGDVVLIPAHAGKTVQDNGKDYIFIKEEMILGELIEK